MVVNWCIYCLSNMILQVFEAPNFYFPLPSLRVILCYEVEQNCIENLWKNDVTAPKFSINFLKIAQPQFLKNTRSDDGCKLMYLLFIKYDFTSLWSTKILLSTTVTSSDFV